MDECYDCVSGSHWLCPDPVDHVCCCQNAPAVIDNPSPITGEGKRGPKFKEASEVLDPVSAGRKRAAALIPQTEGAICEWAGLRFAGGGPRPIIGCVGNPAKARHHGPDKDTFNNERFINLHHICETCHNRWHGENDRYYNEPRPVGMGAWLPAEEDGTPVNRPHDPETVVTPVEQGEHEIKWRIRRSKRVRVVYGDEPRNYRERKHDDDKLPVERVTDTSRIDAIRRHFDGAEDET